MVPSYTGKGGQSLRFRRHERTKTEWRSILIHSLSIFSACSVSDTENVVSSLNSRLRHVHCNYNNTGPQGSDTRAGMGK